MRKFLFFILIILAVEIIAFITLHFLPDPNNQISASHENSAVNTKDKSALWPHPYWGYVLSDHKVHGLKSDIPYPCSTNNKTAIIGGSFIHRLVNNKEKLQVFLKNHKEDKNFTDILFLTLPFMNPTQVFHIASYFKSCLNKAYIFFDFNQSIQHAETNYRGGLLTLPYSSKDLFAETSPQALSLTSRKAYSWLAQRLIDNSSQDGVPYTIRLFFRSIGQRIYSQLAKKSEPSVSNSRVQSEKLFDPIASHQEFSRYLSMLDALLTHFSIDTHYFFKDMNNSLPHIRDKSESALIYEK